MPVLVWIAAIVAAWCLASVVAALTLGVYLRRRADATDPEGALRPLDTGPLRLWLGELPPVPESPASLARRNGFDSLVAGLPAPRPAPDATVRGTPATR